MCYGFESLKKFDVPQQYYLIGLVNSQEEYSQTVLVCQQKRFPCHLRIKSAHLLMDLKFKIAHLVFWILRVIHRGGREPNSRSTLWITLFRLSWI